MFGKGKKAQGAQEQPVVLDDGMEPFRTSPMGTNDPNIVGELNYLDVPPGTDPAGPEVAAEREDAAGMSDYTYE